MIDILDKAFLQWVSKNKMTFLLVVLLGGNVYQYIDHRKVMEVYANRIQEVNNKLQSFSENSLRYERERSGKLEALLRNLVKQSENDSTSTKD